MKSKRKKKIINMIFMILCIIVSLIIAVSTGYLVYNISLFDGVENFIRNCAIVILILIALVLIFSSINLKIKKKKIGLIILLVVMLVISFGEFYISSIAKKASDTLNNITSTKITYSTSIVTLKDNPYNSIDDVKNKKIGIIEDTSSVDSYAIPQDIIKDNKISSDNIVVYEDFYTMMDDLYAKKIDALFIMTNYTALYNTIGKYEKIDTETKIIYTKTEERDKPVDEKTAKLPVTEPFTVLIMGVDSTLQEVKNGASNGDALILVTFNPKTLNATVLSIPRDTYVPIMCFKNQIKNKITHSAWYGESCVERTIENFTGINIDYYVTINFKGVVGLVDAIKGIDIDVPFSFCEQNSDRAWGENQICLDKGYQHLNGEQALAFARHRKTLKTGDIQRGLDQQIVMEGIMNKLTTINSVSQVINILDVIGNSMDTNFSRSQILDFYEVGKKILLASDENANTFKMQQLFLNGYGAMIYDTGMKLTLYNYVYYDSSLAAVTKAMRVNLGLEQPELIKTFSFSANTPYETTIIGKKENKTSTSYPVMPSFVGKNKSVAQAWATKNGKTLQIVEIQSTKSSDVDGTILSQSVHANSLVSSFSSFSINVIKKKSTTDNGNSSSSSKSNSSSSSKSNSSSSTTSSSSKSNSSSSSKSNNSSSSNSSSNSSSSSSSISSSQSSIKSEE